MSIEIILIPLAMAAFAAWKARSVEEGDVCLIETRLKDPVLLTEALRETGATGIVDNDGALSATWGEVSASFARGDDGVLSAHFDSDDREQAMELVSAVDQAYGRAVQRIVIQRVQDRASSMGMSVVSQADASDGTVTIVLEEVLA